MDYEHPTSCDYRVRLDSRLNLIWDVDDIYMTEARRNNWNLGR